MLEDELKEYLIDKKGAGRTNREVDWKSGHCLERSISGEKLQSQKLKGKALCKGEG